MARIRTIKPEFWDSPGTARASLRGRLFYIAMWNWADDYGRGTANPKALIGFAFPNDDEMSVKDFPSLRKEVADCFGVVWYEVDGRPYYAIPTFDKHQRTERKAKPLHPNPPEQTSAVGSTDDTHGTSDADDGSSALGTGEQGNRGTVKTLRDKRAEIDSLFEEFWDAYPKKVDKAAARRAFPSALKRSNIETLVRAAMRYRDDLARKPEFTKNPATWLNAGSWENPELERPTIPLQPVDPRTGRPKASTEW